MDNIVLVSGGNSVEHEISLLTNRQVDKSINKDKYNVYNVYYMADKNRSLQIQKCCGITPDCTLASLRSEGFQKKI